MLLPGRVVSSAVPFTLTKPLKTRRLSSAWCLILVFGSTPKTLFPFSKKTLDSRPVPEPMSATM